MKTTINLVGNLENKNYPIVDDKTLNQEWNFINSFSLYFKGGY